MNNPDKGIGNMLESVKTENGIIEYDLQYKNVKNVNLRIKTDGTVHVSANKRVSKKIIEAFIVDKAHFIIKAQEKYSLQKKADLKQHFSQTQIRDVIVDLCRKHYPYYACRGVKFPIIKFRKMVSRWGSCQPTKGVLTFNTNLMYAPIECVEYVVLHEFTHFLQANHSKNFYFELEKVLPNWKNLRKKLKEISIR